MSPRLGRSTSIRGYVSTATPPSPRRYASICEPRKPGIDWIIVGGESGTAARPFDLAWARTAVQQSKAAGGCRCSSSSWVAGPLCTMPQNGQVPASMSLSSVKLLDRKGGGHVGVARGLRVREFPEVRRG